MREISDNIKTGKFHNAYLLYGPEIYLRSQFERNLIRAVIHDDDSMNLSVFEGRDTDEGNVISQSLTMPFFAERRAVLVRDSGFFKNKTEELAGFIENIPEYLVMIFSETEADKRTRTFKAVQKHGHVAEFGWQSEDTLVRWILTRMKKEGKKITKADMSRFLDSAGTEMTNIDSELQKLLAYCAGRDVITSDDIDAVCAPQIKNRIFDMVRAVTEHRTGSALEYYYDLLSLRESPMRILYLISRQYRQLLQIASLDDAGTPVSEIAAAAGMPPFAVKRTLPLARSYSDSQLTSILEELASLENAVKTGMLEDRMSVEIAITEFSK